MNIATILGYVYSPVESKSKDNRTFNVFKIRYSQSKSNYVFADVYITDNQAKYLGELSKGEQIIITGELSILAYLNKEGQPIPKASIQAKSLKKIYTDAPKEKSPNQEKQEEQEFPWF